MDIIKNPVVIAVIAGVIAFMYLKWKQEKDIKKGKIKKENKYVGLLIPAAVFVIVWFMAYGYFEYSKNCSNEIEYEAGGEGKYGLVKKNPISDHALSFSLLRDGIRVPRTIPEVHIETFRE